MEPQAARVGVDRHVQVGAVEAGEVSDPVSGHDEALLQMRRRTFPAIKGDSADWRQSSCGD
jgi:hypothetical protein